MCVCIFRYICKVKMAIKIAIQYSFSSHAIEWTDWWTNGCSFTFANTHCSHQHLFICPLLWTLFLLLFVCLESCSPRVLTYPKIEYSLIKMHYEPLEWAAIRRLSSACIIFVSECVCVINANKIIWFIEYASGNLCFTAQCSRVLLRWSLFWGEKHKNFSYTRQAER